ncbi:hypothetical protein [Streptomyces sp. NBC_00459]
MRGTAHIVSDVMTRMVTAVGSEARSKEIVRTMPRIGRPMAQPSHSGT